MSAPQFFVQGYHASLTIAHVPPPPGSKRHALPAGKTLRGSAGSVPMFVVAGYTFTDAGPWLMTVTACGSFNMSLEFLQASAQGASR